MTFSCEQWDDLVPAFIRFFDGRGDVRTSDSEATFRTSISEFSLRRDGTSRSFMPLHEFGARWEEVEFDPDGREVWLRGGDTTYTYRVPG